MCPQYLQQSTLDHLKCTNCHLYLSIFPILRNTTCSVIKCGRCLDKNNIPSDLIRDELLEQVLKFQRFPCVNRENGCLEVLLPSKITKHEPKCRYQKLKCPSTDCFAQLMLDEIINHFQDQHPVFVLNGRFEVDLVQTHNENFVMAFEDEVYVINQAGQSAEGIFTVQVNYLGANPDADNYSYGLTLENGNKQKSSIFKERIGNKLTLKSTEVSKLLDNPTAIIATINIINTSKPQIIMNQSIAAIPDDDEDTTALKHLECPVCFHLYLPPIYQCELGHCICESCKDNVAHCPTCHSGFGQTRNFVLEDLIGRTIYPCRYRTEGCRVKKWGRDIRNHELTCLFGPFDCPLKDFENCTSIFKRNQLDDHIKNIHYESLLELDTIYVPFNIGMDIDIEEGYIIQYNSNLFKLYFGYKSEEKKFMWSVQMIGSSEDCAKYNFELDIVDNVSRKKRFFIKSVCSTLSDKSQVFEGDECVFLFYNQISKFIKNFLSFRVYISHNQ